MTVKSFKSPDDELEIPKKILTLGYGFLGKQFYMRFTAKDCPEELHMNRTGKTLKVVVIGEPWGWTVYCEDTHQSMTFDEVETNGHKVLEDYLKNIISASDTMWRKYLN
jgi:hypothetical protein